MRKPQRPGAAVQNPGRRRVDLGKISGASTSPITVDTQVIGLDAYLAARGHRALAAIARRISPPRVSRPELPVV